MNGHSEEYIGILTEQEIEEMEAEQEYYLLMQFYMEGQNVRREESDQREKNEQSQYLPENR